MERKIMHLAVGKPKELNLSNNKRMMTGIEKKACTIRQSNHYRF